MAKAPVVEENLPRHMLKIADVAARSRLYATLRIATICRRLTIFGKVRPIPECLMIASFEKSPTVPVVTQGTMFLLSII